MTYENMSYTRNFIFPKQIDIVEDYQQNKENRGTLLSPHSHNLNADHSKIVYLMSIP